MKTLWIAAWALGAGLLNPKVTHATPAALIDEQPVETYVIRPQPGGEPATVLVQLFDARLLDRPEVVAGLRQLPLEEILSVTEAKGQTREPGQADEFHRREASLDGAAAPLTRVEAPKGMFGRLRHFLRGSFSRLDRDDPDAVADNKKSVQFGLISASVSGTVRAVLLLTDGKAIQEIAAVVATNFLSSFIPNRYSKQLGHLLSRSWNTADPEKMGPVVTGIARRAAWFHLFSEIYAFVDKGQGAWALEPQIQMIMLTMMFGVPDAWASYLFYDRYKKLDPLRPGKLVPDEAKIGLVNFWIGSVTGLASGMDQIQHHLNPVLIPMQHYDFRVSGAVLISYYSVLIYHLVKKPESVHRVFSRFQNFLCNRLLRIAPRKPVDPALPQ